MDTSFVPPAHTPLLSSQVFPLDQYQSAHGNQYPATSQGYSMSYPGYVQPSPSFHQSTVPPALSSPFVPFTSSMYQSQYTVGGSPGTITSGPPFTPVTPSSQGQYYPVTDGSCYGMGYAPAYDNSQAPATQAYTDSTGSVNHPVFFRQNYPPS